MLKTFDNIDKMPGELVILVILGIAAIFFLISKQLPHLPPPPIKKKK